MASHLSCSLPAPARADRTSSTEPLSSEVLLPLVAGAQARGLADAFAMLGLPVLLVGSDGQILHVSALARAAIAGRLMLQADHIVAADPLQNDRLSRLIEQALVRPDVGMAASWTSAALTARDGAPFVTLYARNVAGDGPNSLMQAVLVVDDRTSIVVTSYLERLAGRLPQSLHTAVNAEKGVDDAAQPN